MGVPVGRAVDRRDDGASVSAEGVKAELAA